MLLGDIQTTAEVKAGVFCQASLVTGGLKNVFDIEDDCSSSEQQETCLDTVLLVTVYRCRWKETNARPIVFLCASHSLVSSQ